MNTTLKKVVLYFFGLLIIAVGINVSKLSGLGISPVSATPRALELIWGFSLGKMVIVVYCVLILFQVAVLRKDFKGKNLLGIPVALVFGWLVDLVGIDPNAFGHLLAWIPKPEIYFAKIICLLLSILTIGTGVYIYLKPNLIPMPAEGLALAFSQKTGKAFGDCKSAVDLAMISVALILQLVFLGGLNSFSGSSVVVREGTIASALLVGQVVKFLKRNFQN